MSRPGVWYSFSVMTRQCQQCGEEFKGKPSSNGKFCSSLCFHRSSRKGLNKLCVECGKSFYVQKSILCRKGGGQFCSRLCCGKNKKGKRGENSKKILQKCKQCNKNYLIYPCELTHRGGRKFCSKQCSWKNKKRVVECFCVRCGQKFLVVKSEGKRRVFCSWRCSRRRASFFDSTEDFLRDKIYEDCFSQREKSTSCELWRNYRISLKEWRSLWKEQQGKCRCCSKQLDPNPSRFTVVDHNHKTKKIRGIVCNRCNHGIGIFKDSVPYLQKAVQYLQSFDPLYIS